MEKTITTQKISTDELNNRLMTNRDILLIDTLPKTRYQQIHLPQSVNACVFEVNFLEQVAALTQDKEQSIVVYGESELTHDAKTAAEKLLRAGHITVFILTGGLSAWRTAGYPLEGESIDTEEKTPELLVEGHYQIDTEASVIEWAGRNPNSTHWGTLRLASGEVQVKSGQITGNFTIDMNSIENINLAGNDLQPVLEAHLKSDDFFFVKRFPEAKFEMTAKPTEEQLPVSAPNFEISGNLKLCGISAEQNFPATIVKTDDGKVAAEAHFDIDRTRWGVIYGSTRFFKHLGMHLVFDLISLQLRILTK